MKSSYDFSSGKRGAVIPAANKTRITINIDNDVLDAFRKTASEQGKGYQPLMNDALRKSMIAGTPVTIDNIRQAFREELRRAA